MRNLASTATVLVAAIGLALMVASCGKDPVKSEKSEYSDLEPVVYQTPCSLDAITGDPIYDCDADAAISGTVFFYVAEPYPSDAYPEANYCLYHHTEYTYGVINNVIDIDVTTTPGKIRCELNGIYTPLVQLPTLGPASRNLIMKLEPGTYLLEYVFGDLTNSYKMIAMSDTVVFDVIESSFTEEHMPMYSSSK